MYIPEAVRPSRMLFRSAALQRYTFFINILQWRKKTTYFNAVSHKTTLLIPNIWQSQQVIVIL